MSVTEGLSRGSRPRPTALVLEVTDGPSRETYRLEAGSICVGSQSGCDWVLKDPAISRRHASIELHAGGVRVRDLGSRNGVYYLGARITDAQVPVGSAMQLGRSTIRVRPLVDEEPVSPNTKLGDLVAASVPMRKVFAQVERVAPLDVNVVLQGESGVGKSSLVRVIHQRSGRKGPLVEFGCAGANAELIESELFGHVRGAFSGAHADRTGLFEAARGGTLVLEEVSELPRELQPKLLRVLESGEFRRVGDGEVRTTDARVVSTSQRSMETEVAAGRLRSDLYFRLMGVLILVPPLRARPEDVSVLVDHFVAQLGSRVPLAPGTLAAMQCDAWPGNVRELKNGVERVLNFGATRAPAAGEEVAESTDGLTFSAARQKVLDAFEKDFLLSLLERHDKKIAPAAAAAGISRSQFYRLLERHGIK